MVTVSRHCESDVLVYMVCFVNYISIKLLRERGEEGRGEGREGKEREGKGKGKRQASPFSEEKR